MVVKVSKPALNLREKLSELFKPSGIAGEAMLRAETPQEQFNLIGAGRRNMLINGDFQLWQRGTSGTVNTYTCDRWFGWGYQQALTQQQAENQTSNTGRFALRVAHNEATANTFSSIAQTLETNDIAKARGNKVTFSIDVKKGSGFTGTLNIQIVERTDAEGSINTGTRNVMVTSDITSSLTTSLQRFTVTTSGTVAQNALTLGVNVNHNGTSGTDATNNFQVERAQLEIGDIATPFEYRSYGEELAACQRYYQVTQNFNGNGHSSNGVVGMVTLTGEMRARPAFSQNGVFKITDGYSNDWVQSSTGGILYSSTNKTNGYMLYLQNISGLTAGKHYHARCADANVLQFDAEF